MFIYCDFSGGRISKYIIIMGNMFRKKSKNNLEEPLIDSMEIETFKDDTYHSILTITNRLNVIEDSNYNFRIDDLLKEIKKSEKKIDLLENSNNLLNEKIDLLENSNNLLNEKIVSIEKMISETINTRFYNIENQCEKIFRQLSNDIHLINNKINVSI